MPLFRIVVKRDGADRETATDLIVENVGAAWQVATVMAASFLQELAGDLTTGSGVTFEVHDHTGRLIRVLRISADVGPTISSPDGSDNVIGIAGRRLRQTIARRDR